MEISVGSGGRTAGDTFDARSERVLAGGVAARIERLIGLFRSLSPPSGLSLTAAATLSGHISEASEIDAIDALYWPWAEALHILLDSLIDRAEDRATEQPNLLDHYASQGEMTERLGLLAAQTAERALDVAPHHRLILAGMVALYLSDEQAWTAFARPATERILEATGTFAKPALLVLRARRLAPKARRQPLPFSR